MIIINRIEGLKDLGGLLFADPKTLVSNSLIHTFSHGMRNNNVYFFYSKKCLVGSSGFVNNKGWKFDHRTRI